MADYQKLKKTLRDSEHSPSGEEDSDDEFQFSTYPPETNKERLMAPYDHEYNKLDQLTEPFKSWKQKLGETIPGNLSEALGDELARKFQIPLDQGLPIPQPLPKDHGWNNTIQQFRMEKLDKESAKLNKVLRFQKLMNELRNKGQ